VVLSGDITQRARRAQFDAARRLVDRLAAPALMAIPGNHDIPLYNLAARVLSPYGGYARAFGGELEPSCETDDLLVLAVNTTRAWRHKHGELSAAQIERVAQRLRQCPPDKLRIVVTHQPMHVPPGTDEGNLLRGHVEAARAWAGAGADLVMGGHIHLPYVRLVNERVPDLARPLWAVQAGTAVSRRVRAGAPANSVNVVRCGRAADPGACIVERLDFDPGHCRFGVVARETLALGK
jgi:3',5'-cyclic AMP phosphodiesterase CpdA